ncbi:hypothetical protein IFM89_039703 [Coptis chinensis]|uniref:Phytocyanin domain-containing protein n=1 Tax=Coptis chinensis TaxID=261450 RepID=A0A835LC32_9MAGN|nr:hypothetical protein IFM89_039703 [Coptis chinensis]
MLKVNYYYFFFIVFTASLSLSTTRGETHLVGDDEGWTQFPNFTYWAKGKSFHVGDTLVFSYAQELHNVVQVNGTSYEDCIMEPNLGVLQSGNDSITVAEVGQLWYICGVEDHCKNGQKLTIEVLP